MFENTQSGGITRRAFLITGGAVVGLGAIGAALKFGIPLLKRAPDEQIPVATTYNPSLESQVVEAGNARPATTKEFSTALNEAMQVAGGDQAHSEDTMLYPIKLNDNDQTNISFTKADIPFLNKYTQEKEYINLGPGQGGVNFRHQGYLRGGRGVGGRVRTGGHQR